MMFKLSSALSATLLILSTLMLNGCGETGDLSSTKSVSFNLLSIEVSDSGIATFDWDDSSGASEYIICRKDNTQNNQCEELLTVTSGTTGTVNIGSILEAAVSEYFILAKNEELVALSNKRSIESSELANLITYVKASNTDSSDNFGNSISLSTDGNTLAVGAHYEDSNSTSLNGDQANNSAASSGAVYLFRYKNNQWSQQAYIKAPNAEASDTFGSSVSLSSDGNTLVVGARGEEGGVPGINVNPADNSIPNAGAAYIFTFDGMDWNHQAYVKASNPGDGDHFGTAVALSPDGSTLAVGADEESSDLKGTYALPPTDNNLQSYAGAVYLFRYNGSNWVQEAYIKASNTESGDRFGSSLSLSQDGNTLAVGATGERSNATGVNGEQSNNDLFSSGAVYLFRFDGSSWVQQAYLKASDTSSAGFFGASVSLSSNGNLLGVGGYGQNSSSGAAYVYQFDGSDWSEQAYLTASNAESSDYFGNSVALSPEGNALLVGALFERSNAIGVNGEQTDNSALASGAAYLFRFDGSLWEQEFYIKSSNTEATDRFGLSVSLSSNGSRLVISTVRESSSATGINGDQSDNSASRSGAVYVY